MAGHVGGQVEDGVHRDHQPCPVPSPLRRRHRHLRLHIPEAKKETEGNAPYALSMINKGQLLLPRYILRHFTLKQGPDLRYLRRTNWKWGIFWVK